MKNFAPHITRQRLLIEGFYTIDVDKKIINNYFQNITKSLNLRMYGEPIIFSPGEEGREENQGYDAFAPLIDSGISVYIWKNFSFLSIIVYTCKNFEKNKAVEFTKEFFKIKEIESFSF